jgi:hypothetical protein
MVRWLSAATAGLAVLSIASLAHAQHTGGSFGDQGEFIISADRLFPLIGYTHSSAVQFGAGGVAGANRVVDHGDSSSLGFFWGGTDTIATDTAAVQNPYTVPRVGFDYTVVPNVTVGGDLVVYFTLGASGSQEVDLNNGGTQTTSGPGPKTTIFGVAPRAGYILHFSELVSLWLRGGLSYYTLTVHSSPVNGTNDSNNLDQLSLDVDPQLAITPLPHLGFTIGATTDIPLTGGHSLTSTTGGASTSDSAHASLFFIGATAGMFVYF